MMTSFDMPRDLRGDEFVYDRLHKASGANGSVCCAYCGVVILADERRAHTANYFERWGYLHAACERAMVLNISEEG